MLEGFEHPYESEIEFALVEQTLDQFIDLGEKQLIPYLYRRYWIERIRSTKLPPYKPNEIKSDFITFWLKTVGIPSDRLVYKDSIVPTNVTLGSPLRNIFESVEERFCRMYNSYNDEVDSKGELKRARKDVQLLFNKEKQRQKKRKETS